MGRKKATALKPETKALLDAHLDAASAAPKADAQLFFVDKSAAAVKGAGGKQPQAAGIKRKRDSTATADVQLIGTKAKQPKLAAAPAVKKEEDEDRMDTSTDPASAAAASARALMDDSDDERAARPEKNRNSRFAAQGRYGPRILGDKEQARRAKETVIKAEKEALAQESKPKLFDLWATTLEEDLVKGIRPATNEKGFRTGFHTKQDRFRHGGKEQNKAHLKASVLPKAIEAGTSFHPDHGVHQALLKKALDKDQAERDEQAAIHARFKLLPSNPEKSFLEQQAADFAEEEARKKAGAGGADGDAWMDEPVKNAPTSSTKFSVAKRNKLARAQANREKTAAQQDEKALGKIVGRLPVLVAQMKKEDKLRAKERARIAHLKETMPDHGPKLGKHAEEEAFPDVALTDELPTDGALRALKPSSALIKDQFSRFEQRHLIEPRKRVKQQRRGPKARSYDRFKNDPQGTKEEQK